MKCPICYSESRRRKREKRALCTRCGLRIHSRDVNLKLGRTLCNQCYDDLMKEKKENFCASCNKRLRGASYQRPDGYRLCLDCMRDQSPGGGSHMGVRACDRCGNHSILQYVTGSGERVCRNCSKKYTDKSTLKKLLDAINIFRK